MAERLPRSALRSRLIGHYIRASPQGHRGGLQVRRPQNASAAATRHGRRHLSSSSCVTAVNFPIGVFLEGILRDRTPLYPVFFWQPSVLPHSVIISFLFSSSPSWFSSQVEREVSAFQAQASSNTASNLRPSAPTTVASSNTPAANGNSNMYEMAREKEVARREIRAVAAATAAATAADARADAADARTAATRNQPISSNGGLPPAPDGSGSAPQSPPRAQHEQASQQLLRKKSQEGIAVNGGGGGGGALEAIRRAGSSSSSSSSTLSSNAMRTAAAYTSGRSANGGLLTKTSRSSSRGRRCSSGSGRRGSSGLSGDDTGNNTINHNNSGSSASAAALNGAALNQMKYDELRAAMQNNGGKFGKLESRSGAGGLPPHRTLPQIPPLNSHLSTSGSSGNGSNNTAIMNGSNLNNNNNGSSALVGAGPGGNPRPGSRQMINALRSKSVTAQAQGDQMQQQQQQLPLARITPRSGRRGSLLGAK